MPRGPETWRPDCGRRASDASRRGHTAGRGIAGPNVNRPIGAPDSGVMPSIRILFAENKETNRHKEGYKIPPDGSPSAILSRLSFRDTSRHNSRCDSTQQ